MATLPTSPSRSQRRTGARADTRSTEEFDVSALKRRPWGESETCAGISEDFRPYADLFGSQPLLFSLEPEPAPAAPSSETTAPLPIVWDFEEAEVLAAKEDDAEPAPSPRAATTEVSLSELARSLGTSVELLAQLDDGRSETPGARARQHHAPEPRRLSSHSRASIAQGFNLTSGLTA